MAMAKPKEKGAGIMGVGLPSLKRVGCACREYATSVCLVERQLTTGAYARSCIRSAYSTLAPDFNGWNTRWSLFSQMGNLHLSSLLAIGTSFCFTEQQSPHESMTRGYEHEECSERQACPRAMDKVSLHYPLDPRNDPMEPYARSLKRSWT